MRVVRRVSVLAYQLEKKEDRNRFPPLVFS